MKSDELPKLPQRNLEVPPRRAKEMKPGERGVLMKSMAISVDENFHVWVDSEQTLMDCVPFPPLTVQVERTDIGFVLWLDKKITFKPEKLSRQRPWIPVVEFREAKEEDE